MIAGDIKKERPILFSAPMVNAILDGSKTQTRRALRHQPEEIKHMFMKNNMSYVENIHGVEIPHWSCPYGKVGDKLWVREAWNHSNFPFGPLESGCDIFYRADYLDDPLGPDLEKSEDGIRRKWKPSIHLPRWASRINLEITGIRLERLQDISDDDCLAEGSENSSLPGIIREKYKQIWESINGPESWNANPWVWVIEFRNDL